MHYKKKGFPDENEVVICTVKKILPHSVFVDLDEFTNREGLIHISEISPGRIRNIRDYVKEGKKIVCKVLKKDEKRGHIDLSLRRVNQAQRINKNKEFKQEQKAEKILEVTGKDLKLSMDDMYGKIGEEIVSKFGSLHKGFEEISESLELMDNLEADKKIKDILLGYIKERVVKREIKISATLTLASQESNGIETIKKTIKALEDKNPSSTIKYLGAPHYHLNLTAKDYKEAEKVLAKISEEGKSLMKNKGVFNLERDDKRNS